MSDVRKAIEDGGRKLGAALTAKDFDAAARLYTEDAALLPPNAPVIRGRAAIGVFWRDAAAALGLVSASLKTEEVTVSGDMAVEVGSAALTLATGVAHVKFMVAWRRDGDGVWRLHRDIWNALPAT